MYLSLLYVFIANYIGQFSVFIEKEHGCIIIQFQEFLCNKYKKIYQLSLKILQEKTQGIVLRHSNTSIKRITI